MILIPYFQAITANINTGDTYQFYYGEKDWQNLVADNAAFPVVFVDFISKVNYGLKAGGFLNEEYPVSIYFGHKSELDWTSLEHEVVIDKAHAAARNFISQLQNYKDINGNKIIDSVEFVNADRVILRPNDDVGTSGIFLQLKIKPALNVAVCV